jgi:hypothetical protein
VTDTHEQAIQEFLEPLRSVQPVTRPAPHLGRSRRRGVPLIGYAAIVIGMIALVAAISLLSHKSASPQPAGSGPVTDHGPTHGAFATARGWITVGGAVVQAFDPSDPARRVVLWHHPGEPLAWSAAGTKLLIDGYKAGFIVLRADGSTTHIAPSKDSAGGVFARDGSQVIYSRRGKVYRVSTSGGRAHVIGAGMMPFFTGGLLSPDGSTLALQSNGVTTMNVANGRQETVLTAAQVESFNHDKLANQISPLAWYPDGTRLLMIALNQRATHCYTFTVGLDGRGYERVGPRGFCPLRATSSGDGSQFAFLLSTHPGRFGQFATLPSAEEPHHLRKFQIAGSHFSINLAWNPLEPRE